MDPRCLADEIEIMRTGDNAAVWPYARVQPSEVPFVAGKYRAALRNREGQHVLIGSSTVCESSVTYRQHIVAKPT